MTVTTRFLGSPINSPGQFFTLPNKSSAPSIIDNYSIIRVIGQGGMGTVFEARHTDLGKRFALKLLSESLRDNQEAIERFRTETLALGKLEHPNIIMAIDAGNWQGCPFLVTELLDGADLERHVKEHGKMDAATAASIAMQLVEALDYAHEHGFYHRDIKPTNIFLQPDGKAKLLDFGLVRSKSNQTLTQVGHFMGTVDFVAPEQAGNAIQATAASDIYSLGCTLIYLLSGDVPFPDTRYPSIISKLQAHAQELPTWLDDPEDQTPRWLKLLIRRMVAKKPNDRPNCSDIRDVLKQQLEVVSTSYCSIAKDHSSHRFLKWMSVATASALALIIVGLTLVGLGQPPLKHGTNSYQEPTTTRDISELPIPTEDTGPPQTDDGQSKSTSSKTLSASSVKNARGVAIPRKLLGKELHLPASSKQEDSNNE